MYECPDDLGEFRNLRMQFNNDHIPSKPVAPIFKEQIEFTTNKYDNGSERQPGAISLFICQPLQTQTQNYEFTAQRQIKNTW